MSTSVTFACVHSRSVADELLASWDVETADWSGGDIVVSSVAMRTAATMMRPPTATEIQRIRMLLQNFVCAVDSVVGLSEDHAGDADAAIFF